MSVEDDINRVLVKTSRMCQALGSIQHHRKIILIKSTPRAPRVRGCQTGQEQGLRQSQASLLCMGMNVASQASSSRSGKTRPVKTGRGPQHHELRRHCQGQQEGRGCAPGVGETQVSQAQKSCPNRQASKGHTCSGREPGWEAGIETLLGPAGLNWNFALTSQGEAWASNVTPDARKTTDCN